MNSVAFEIALLAFLLGIVVDLLLNPSRSSCRIIPYVLGILGSALEVVVGIKVLVHGPIAIDLGPLLGLGETIFRIDNLAAFFMIWLFGLAFVISIITANWIQKDSSPRRKGLASGYLLLMASTSVIIVADDAFTFIFAWESLTLAFFILTSITRQSRSQAEDSWLTLGIQKIGGASILLGFLLLAGSSQSLFFSSWSTSHGGGLHGAAYGLIVFGFGAKLGIVPLQAWMPSGYSIASGPTRAVMAGVAANTAVYGLLRFFSILGRPPIWLVVAVLLLGGITALLGITFAGVERRLSKLVAYSSVENAGIIFTAFGVALAGAAAGNTMLIAAGLLAAMMHSIAHSVAKSTLFSSLSEIETTARSDDLEEISGIARALPGSGISFTLGALTLAGLPPTIGFVSEWLVLESLMQEFRISSLAIRLALLLAGALVALTSGLAALAFIRVIGISLLGKAKSGLNQSGNSVIWNLPTLFLAGSCLAISAITPLEVRLVSRGLSSLVPRRVMNGSLHSPWVIQPVFPNFSILSPSWLFIEMPAAFLGVLLLSWLVSRRSYFKVRKVPPWHSATAGVVGRSSYTAFGYANLLRHLLSNILGTVRERRRIYSNGASEERETVSELRYETRVTEPVQTFLYRPMAAAVLATVVLVKRFQSGKLQSYLTYMLLTLLVALLLVASLR
ncbi:MAG: proton-conducting transporter membrane subunit [Actinomycetota bacterium]|jgi:formate hydrogenlyase subunit 3/multisubunit Na+/H+ antiporter MnhD subunit|nr:proton-conducting transporter membrane subunit [Actinomycetota bacterium]